MQHHQKHRIAMIINKTQGQSLQVCGINLEFLVLRMENVFARRKTIIFIYLRTAKNEKIYSIRKLQIYLMYNQLLCTAVDVF